MVDAACPSQPMGKLAMLNRTLARPFKQRVRRSTTGGIASLSSPSNAADALPHMPTARAKPSSMAAAATSTASATAMQVLSPQGLEARRVAERDFVLSHDSSNTDIWYLIDVGWLTEWKRFVSQGGPLPGPLRSEALVDRRTGRPRPGLQPIHHYRGVNAEVWTYWCRQYGGNSPVRRRLLDLYAKPVDDMPMPLPEPSLPHSTCDDQPQASTMQTPERRSTATMPHVVSSSCTGGSRAAASAKDGDEMSGMSCDNTGWVFFVKENSACIVSQPPDGSCLFHSLSYGLDDGSDAASLRTEISDFIALNPDLAIAGTALKDWVKFDSGGGVDAYAADVAGGTWGGGIELEVFVRLKSVTVHVYEGCPGGYRRICVFDGGPKAVRTLSVLYRDRGSRGMEHYDALLLDDAAGQWLPRTNFEPGAPGGA
mmetsp:Transcript_116850/g.330596  ORF Transcript_116850/g.330596 Transcript_116850/m.330596 type:complete len:426 (-) Transcript_116850:120-1397(-)